MLPFSVLRTWGSGILGWALLVGGVYCIWKWNEKNQPVVIQAVQPEAEIDSEQPSFIARRETGHWPLLIAGIGLLVVSGVGYLPITLLLGNPGKAKKPPSDRNTQWVERPDGSRLYVEVFGARNGPTLIFTHGWSLENRVWDEVTQNLFKRYRIVTWDLAGLGRSRRSSSHDHSIERMAHDLAAVLRGFTLVE